MRLTKGCKVEVLCKKDMSFGAWRCAEIISDDGDTFTVRCEPTPGMSNGKIVKRVPRTDIRPSPPRLESALNWSPGDVLEVLDDASWKSATVLKVMDDDYFLIRILGSFEEFRAHVSKTRLRQTWKDGKWVVQGEATQSREFTKSSNKDFICYDIADSYDRIKERHRLQDSYIVSARSLKRTSPFSSFYVEAYPSKVRAVEAQKKDRPVVVSRSSSSLINVVDTDSALRKTLNGASSSTGIGEYGGSDDIDTNSVADSCSVNSNRMNELPGNVLAGHSQEADADSSDAESCCGYRDEEEKDYFPNPEEETLRVHQLELVAYRSTMAAIHASGPLSWEHEELLTNLRITLHITHDEHSTEGNARVCVRNSKQGMYSLLCYDCSVCITSDLGPAVLCESYKCVPMLEACLPCFEKICDDSWLYIMAIARIYNAVLNWIITRTVIVARMRNYFMMLKKGLLQWNSDDSPAGGSSISSHPHRR